MKKTFFILSAAAMSLAACNKTVLDAPVEYGYLNFDVAADNTIKVETKAGDEDFTYDVKDFTVAFGGKNYTVAELASPVVIGTGTYPVEAYNCTLEAGETGNGQLRMADTESVTVNANETATVTLRCTPKSSEVKLVYSAAYKALYPNSEFTLIGTRNKVADTRLEMTEGVPVYYNNTENGTVAVKYEIKAEGESSTQNTTFGGSLTLKNAYSLTVTVDVQKADGKISIDLKATNMLTKESSTITVNPYTGNSSVAQN